MFKGVLNFNCRCNIDILFARDNSFSLDKKIIVSNRWIFIIICITRRLDMGDVVHEHDGFNTF